MVNITGFFLSFMSLACILSTVASAESPTVGVILPLTGNAAWWGTNSRRGIELAIEDAHRANPKHELPKFVFEDEACDPKTAVAVFKKLVEWDRVNIVLGPSCSSSTLAVAPLANSTKVPIFAFSEADSISGINPFTFRLWVPNGLQASALAKYIAEDLNIRSVAVLAIQNAYGEDFARRLRAELGLRGARVVADERYAANDPSPRAQLVKIKSRSPGAFIFLSYIADGVNIMKLTRSIGISVPVFSASATHSSHFLNSTKGISDGVVLFDLPDRTSQTFREHWRSRFKDEWPGTQSGAAVFYDFTRFLLSALTQVGANGTALQEFFRAGRSYQGESMELRFNSAGDLGAQHVPFIIKNGAFAEIPTGKI